MFPKKVKEMTRIFRTPQNLLVDNAYNLIVDVEQKKNVGSEYIQKLLNDEN